VPHAYPSRCAAVRATTRLRTHQVPRCATTHLGKGCEVSATTHLAPRSFTTSPVRTVTGKGHLQTVPVVPVKLSIEGPDSVLARLKRPHSGTAACRGILAPTPVITVSPVMPLVPGTLPLYRPGRVSSRLKRPQSNTAACRGVVAPTPGEPVDPPGVTRVTLDCVKVDYCNTPVWRQHESRQRQCRTASQRATRQQSATDTRAAHSSTFSCADAMQRTWCLPRCGSSPADPSDCHANRVT